MPPPHPIPPQGPATVLIHVFWTSYCFTGIMEDDGMVYIVRQLWSGPGKLIFFFGVYFK